MFFDHPTRFFVCSGAGEGRTTLNAFDAALLDSQVGNTNLMKMSSILPPHVVQSEAIPLPPGAFIPIAYASISSTTPAEVISAAVAVGIPVDPSLNGVIMEYSARGQAADVEAIVRNMASEAMALRGFAVKEIVSTSIQHRVDHIGAAFAGVVLV